MYRFASQRPGKQCIIRRPVSSVRGGSGRTEGVFRNRRCVIAVAAAVAHEVAAARSFRGVGHRVGSCTMISQRSRQHYTVPLTCLEDPAVVRAYDLCSGVRWPVTCSGRADGEEEVALQFVRIREVDVKRNGSCAYQATSVGDGVRTAIATHVLNKEVDAAGVSRLAVVGASGVRLPRPELQSIAGPCAEVVEDWRDLSVQRSRADGVVLALPSQKIS